MGDRWFIARLRWNIRRTSCLSSQFPPTIEDQMKKFALMLAAAAMLYSAAPASAQSVSVGPGGVRVDSNDRGYSGDRGYRGREYRGRDWRRSRGEYRSRRVVV